MKIFDQLVSKFMEKGPDMSGPIPGAMGKLLAQMGIHELGPHMRKGTPTSVLNGCRKELVLIPGATRPAFTKDGKPLMARDKHGRVYHVTDNYAVDKKRWKQMQRDQAREASGRWFSGKKAQA